MYTGSAQWDNVARVSGCGSWLVCEIEYPRSILECVRCVWMRVGACACASDGGHKKHG